MSDPHDDGVHPYPVSAGREQTPEAKARRTTAAKIAAHTRWAMEPDRRAATQAMRDGLQRKFEDAVDPDRVLDPIERATRVESYKRAYYLRITQKSAETRRARKRQS